VGGALLFVALAVGAPAIKDARKPADPPDGLWRGGGEHDGVPFLGTATSVRIDTEEWDLWSVGRTGLERRAARASFFVRGEVGEVDLDAQDPDRARQGIWSLNGDDLKVCLGPPGGPRPTAFAAPTGSGRTLWKLHRDSD
jgi:hypothetical protein